MKKTLIIVSAFFLGLTSCQSDLDVLPEDLTTREKAFQTEVGVKSYVTGMYGLAQQEGALNGVPQAIADYQSDNVTFRGSFPTLRDIRDYVTLSDNGNVFSIWDDHYEIISQANYIINKISTCPDSNFDIDERNQAVGEAKFIRALMYLQLNNLFSQPIQNAGSAGLSIPLITTVIEDAQLGTKAIPRATIGQVYAQIENDLIDAATLITDFSRTRANSGAAKALLARVYLYQDKFGLAANLANDVINNSNFKLATNYTFYDSPANEEHVFTLVNTPDDSQDGSGATGGAPAVAFSNLYNSATDNGRGDCPFSTNLRTDFGTEPSDLRFTLKKQDAGTTTTIRFFTTKYSDGQNLASDAAVIRISEMYLTRAEANFRNATSIGDTPLNDVNKIRQRAGLSNLASVTLNQILTERRKELCFEGHRRMDLLRNNLPLRSVGLPQAAISAPGQNKVILPIPQREIDLSIGKVLVQNPGY
jgi:starch-binding outer membrane protein, SusD/RagB family